MFFTWKNYSDHVHTKSYECHVFMDFIILASQLDNIPSLSTNMHEISHIF